MANLKQVENMLLTEHFTWTPISLIDDIINTVNEVAYKATESLERGLLDHADPSALGFLDRANAENRIPETEEDDEGNSRQVFPEARLEIEEGVHKLETLLENTIDRNFDRLEIWTLRNVLTVPGDVVGWVRLGGYENFTIPPPNPSITPESLQSLRRKLQETQKLHTALLSEKTRNEALLAKLRALVSAPPPQSTRASTVSTMEIKEEDDAEKNHMFGFLTHTPAARELGIQGLPLVGGASSNAGRESSNPLTTHTTFTTSQLPFLRSLLSQLKPHLASASLPRSQDTYMAGTDRGTAEKARDRKVYIESQSKSILERGGVDIRDGVEGGVGLEGRRVREEEVRGLEGLVAGISRGDVKERDEKGERVEEMDTS
ncbi:Mis12-domain-containing protein [Delitschia confertaspora ATCC 74209]|uniref:Mis12-domain-containing protein n=1 Tax=Delitschia confertaspora ATCC 74209 TaxID=1513339 RepID=A0A9P4JTJ5_9PLEO|nr:Mis12-domain-containing protein [Delitschia confertaspora ATCC 74209]